MSRLSQALWLSVCLFAASAVFAKSAPKPLQIYFIDVEGGQSTLFVTPARQSLLIDTGWPDFNGRDADRIVKAAKEARLKQIDYVLITHYHRDHVGGAPQLAERFKIGTYVDHGPNLEDSDVTREDYAAYKKLLPKAKHLVLRPGSGLPLKGVTLEALTGAGDHIPGPLPGAGTANPLCESEPEPPTDTSENGRSLGVLITFGKLRIIDLGDLTKKKELELMCPNNMVGTADLLVVSHHGFDQSSSKALVWALQPRVAIMDNGAHKGGSPDAWQTVHDSPGLQGLWQLHYAVDGGKEHNVADDMIANVDGKEDGNFIKVTALPDGTITVLNSRNNFEKFYKNK
ncbi:MAG TPA: MBL fold metallo-hydrolase [Terriglobales bacterium]|nr:MBL fold metallo-hydrolase [Terriglobales bacterium]